MVRTRKRWHLFAFLSLLFVVGCRQQVKKAVHVNDQVVSYHGEIMDAFDAFTTALARQDPTGVSESREQLRETSDQKIRMLEDLPEVKSDDDLKAAARESFEFYGQLATEDLKMLSRWYLADSITFQQSDSIDQVLNSIQSREAALDREFKESQEEFAAFHGFGLK